MTDSPEIKQTVGSPAGLRRREVKRRARECFYTRTNSLTLIAVTLIPLILLMALQGMYLMLESSFDSLEEVWRVHAYAVMDVLLTLLILPLVGGTLYVVAGIASGKERAPRDIFYAYSSPRAYVRVWIAFGIPLLAVALVVVLVVMLLQVSQALCDMALTFEEWEPYAYLMLTGGEVFSAVIGIVGALLCGYLTPFLWLVIAKPEMKLSAALSQSISLAHGHLWELAVMHLSFLGWLLLSALTVGVLLVLFVLPYYLLTMALYVSALSDEPR